MTLLLLSLLAVAPAIPMLPVLPEEAPRSQAVRCVPAEPPSVGCRLEFEGELVQRFRGAKLVAFQVRVLRPLVGEVPETVWVAANLHHRRGLRVGRRYRLVVQAEVPLGPLSLLVVGHEALPPAPP